MRIHICAVDNCESDSSAFKIQAEFGGDPFSLSLEEKKEKKKKGPFSEDIKQFKFAGIWRNSSSNKAICECLFLVSSFVFSSPSSLFRFQFQFKRSSRNIRQFDQNKKGKNMVVCSKCPEYFHWWVADMFSPVKLSIIWTRVSRNQFKKKAANSEESDKTSSFEFFLGHVN